MMTPNEEMVRQIDDLPGWTSQRLPEPYDGILWWRGGRCDWCADAWCGSGACICGAEFYTVMVSGEHPDPEDAGFGQ